MTIFDKFEDETWNHKREALEAGLVASATALMAHTEADGMSFVSEGISIQLTLVAYEGEKT